MGPKEENKRCERHSGTAAETSVFLKAYIRSKSYSVANTIMDMCLGKILKTATKQKKKRSYTEYNFSEINAFLIILILIFHNVIKKKKKKLTNYQNL